MEILTYIRAHVGRAAAPGILVIGVLLAAGSFAAVVPAQPPLDEYQVKAAFLYNFAKFIEWPVGSFQRPNDPIMICILGLDPFGRSLENIVSNHSIDGRSLVVRHIAGMKQTAGCHELFISAAESRRSPPVLAEIRSAGILTIGDSDSSAPDGVIIVFRLDGGNIRFVINTEAADRARLHISSRLLSLAH